MGGIWGRMMRSPGDGGDAVGGGPGRAYRRALSPIRTGQPRTAGPGRLVRMVRTTPDRGRPIDATELEPAERWVSPTVPGLCARRSLDHPARKKRSKRWVFHLSRAVGPRRSVAGRTPITANSASSKNTPVLFEHRVSADYACQDAGAAIYPSFGHTATAPKLHNKAPANSVWEMRFSCGSEVRR